MIALRRPLLDSLAAVSYRGGTMVLRSSALMLALCAAACGPNRIRILVPPRPGRGAGTAGRRVGGQGGWPGPGGGDVAGPRGEPPGRAADSKGEWASLGGGRVDLAGEDPRSRWGWHTVTQAR